MHTSEFSQVDLERVPDQLQRHLIELLIRIDLLADEAEYKSGQQVHRHDIAFYQGVVFGLEIAHNEITRELYRAIAECIPNSSDD